MRRSGHRANAYAAHARRSWPVALVGALAIGWAVRAQAQTPVPLGGDFQVNTYTAFDQLRPAVAARLLGSFVVVWESAGSPGSDASGTSIQAQRFSDAGEKLGVQFQVNSYVDGDQVLPAVAVAPGGSFVVVWQSDGSATDPASSSIQAQRYFAAGAPLGPQFEVNTYTWGAQRDPSVATDVEGNFVVVWSGEGPDDSVGIHARLFAANGAPLGPQFRVNADPANPQFRPTVARAAGGDFVVVWDGSDEDADGFGVEGRRFAADGSPLGGDFEVNTYTDASQGRASVSVDSAGSFVVLWESNGSSGSDASGLSIQGQRLDAEGMPLGAEFQVNSHTEGNQTLPAVAAEPGGGFVATWTSGYLGTGPDGSGAGIQGRRYGPDGAARDAEFAVNAWAPGEQVSPSVAVQPGGRFVVAWASEGSAGTDASGGSIQARRFATPPNQPPVAACGDVLVPTDAGTCAAAVSVDGGSSDPDGGRLTIEQEPPGPYPLGASLVRLTVTDAEGASETCEAIVTVVDEEPPAVACNAPATIAPSAAPIAFTATALDNCSVASVRVAAFECFALTPNGMRVARGCEIDATSATLVVSRAGGVGTHVSWTVAAGDASGREATAACGLDVVEPSAYPR